MTKAKQTTTTIQIGDGGAPTGKELRMTKTIIFILYIFKENSTLKIQISKKNPPAVDHWFKVVSMKSQV